MLMSVIAEVAAECLLCRQLLQQSYAGIERNETCPDPAIYVRDGNISAEDSPFVCLNCCTFNKYFVFSPLPIHLCHHKLSPNCRQHKIHLQFQGKTLIKGIICDAK